MTLLTGKPLLLMLSILLITHVWELGGVEVQRGSSNTYVDDTGSVRYQGKYTDDNTTKIGAWR